jgi:outer membrane protein TolC
VQSYTGSHRAAPAANLRLTALAVLLFALRWPLAIAADAPLTLAEAQRRAVERSQSLTAQDAAISAAREMAVAAGQFPDPVLSIGVDNLPVDGPDAWSIGRDFMTMRKIGLMQEVTREEKRGLRAQRFEREADKDRADKVVLMASIRRDTALAWLDRYYAEAMAAVVADQQQQARLEIEAAESAYRAGRGGQADIYSARSALIALDDRASELGRRVRNAKTMLARWVGVAADSPLAGDPSIDAITLDPRTLDAEIEHHPEIAALARQVDVAVAEAKVAEANRTPDWSVQVMYSQRGSAYSNMVSFGVSIPLPWDRAQRQDREVAAKLAMADQARAQREDMLRAHTAELRAQVAEWDNGRERRARYEQQMIPLARDRTAAALSAYRGGKSSLTDVLAARRNEIDVRMQALQLQADTARLWAQLNFLVPDDGAMHTAARATSSAEFRKDLP